jgi:hypothetical protein
MLGTSKLWQKSFTLILSFALSFAACATRPTRPPCEDSLQVFNLNPENMQNWFPDEGKHDAEFLPKNHPKKLEALKDPSLNGARRRSLEESDWTEERFRLKLRQTTRVVNSFNPIRKSDIVNFVEIDGQFTLDEMAKAMEYPPGVSTESVDDRGMDVGSLYKEKDGFKFVRSEFHNVSRNLNRPTRDILEMEYNFHGLQLIIFTNHWPSQGAPAAERDKVAAELQQIMAARQAKNPNVYMLAVGDFNVIDSDYPHPFMGRLLAKDSKVSLLDLHSAHVAYLKNNKMWKELDALPKGTYFYPPTMQWNLLDRVFMTPNFMAENSPLRIFPESYRIHASKDFSTTHTQREGDFNAGSIVRPVPWSYNHNTSNPEETGFGDHWGAGFEISFVKVP